MITNKDIQSELEKLIDNATDKKLIDDVAKINALIESKDKEDKEFYKNHNELVKSYGEVVKNSSFKLSPSEANDGATQKAVTFDDFLNDFIAKKGE